MPDDCGKRNPRRVTQVFCTNSDSQASMVQARVAENETRFGQAKRAPPTHSPSCNAPVEFGGTIEAQETLPGTHAQCFLEELRVHATVIAKGPVTLELPLPAQHVLGWKRQKEAAALEPAGLSFSHCTRHQLRIQRWPKQIDLCAIFPVAKVSCQLPGNLLLTWRF